MELAQQGVSSLQGIAEVDRVAPSIRVRGRSATAVGTHDVDFLIARHEAQHLERFPSFHEESLPVGRRRVPRHSTCRSSEHTTDERRWSHEEISRGLRRVKPVAPRSPLPRLVPSSLGRSMARPRRVTAFATNDADGVEDHLATPATLIRRSCRNCAPAGVTEAVHVLPFAHHR
jgi:hypothetical protein